MKQQIELFPHPKFNHQVDRSKSDARNKNVKEASINISTSKLWTFAGSSRFFSFYKDDIID